MMDRQERRLRRTHDVNRPPIEAESKHEATVAPNILRVVVYDLTAYYYPPNVQVRNHSIGSRHLTDGVREKGNPLARRLGDLAPERNSILPGHNLLEPLPAPEFQEHLVA